MVKCFWACFDGSTWCWFCLWVWVFMTEWWLGRISRSTQSLLSFSTCFVLLSMDPTQLSSLFAAGSSPLVLGDCRSLYSIYLTIWSEWVFHLMNFRTFPHFMVATQKSLRFQLLFKCVYFDCCSQCWDLFELKSGHCTGYAWEELSYCPSH